MTFPQSMDITQMSNNFSNADIALRSTIVQAIYEGVDDGDKTTDAITWTSVSEADMLTIVKELLQQGFGVTLGSGTLAITWQ